MSEPRSGAEERLRLLLYGRETTGERLKRDGPFSREACLLDAVVDWLRERADDGGVISKDLLDAADDLEGMIK